MAAYREGNQVASFQVEAYQGAYRALAAFQEAFPVASQVEIQGASYPEEILEAFLKIQFRNIIFLSVIFDYLTS